jgi:hypothetical protein
MQIKRIKNGLRRQRATPVQKEMEVKILINALYSFKVAAN